MSDLHVCRLYSACPHLEYVVMAEGDLKGVHRRPACAVAAPGACWHEVKRPKSHLLAPAHVYFRRV